MTNSQIFKPKQNMTSPQSPTFISSDSQPGEDPKRPVLLTVQQTADLLQVSPAWVRDHATRKQPHLPRVKLGKLVRFRKDDVEAFIRAWAQ